MLLGSSIKFSAEEWTFVVLFLSVIDTEEDISEENVEHVWIFVWESNVDVVDVVDDADDVVLPHWTCTIPPRPPAIQQIWYKSRPVW